MQSYTQWTQRSRQEGNRVNSRQERAKSLYGGFSIRQLLRDEEGFLRRAGAQQLTQAVLFFRDMAAKAMTPQMRDFYLDRANEFSMKALNGSEASGSRYGGRMLAS